MPTFSFPSNSATVTKKKSKKVEKPQPAPKPEPEPEPEPKTETDTEPEHVPEVGSETVSDAEPDEPRREPTFPDIVILKQTDKNYIVKHNHYIIPLQDKSDNNDTKNIPVHVSATPSDLVSPNQIYKGQINKKLQYFGKK